ncbi:ArsR/SmtB family transcription factor [Geoglobus ahangari]
MDKQITGDSNFPERLDDVFYIEHLHSEKAKLLASEISNDTACRILKELYRNPLSITDLSERLNMPVSTVQYHVNKLMELGVIKIARKRLGRRMRDVKMYVYDKESIVFLSSMEKHEFERLLKMFVVHYVKRQLPAVLTISSLLGLVFGLAGSVAIRRFIESKFAVFRDNVAGGAGGVDVGHIFVIFFIVCFITAMANFVVIIFILKRN